MATNQQRVADYGQPPLATGSVPMDVRSIALAINKGCLNIDVASNQVVSTTGTPLTVNQAFYRSQWYEH